jgi:hypothetical protein
MCQATCPAATVDLCHLVVASVAIDNERNSCEAEHLLRRLAAPATKTPATTSRVHGLRLRFPQDVYQPGHTLFERTRVVMAREVDHNTVTDRLG